MTESTPEQKTANQPALVGKTKRQQIDKTNKTIFIWVAISGAVLALSAVFMQFLIKEALFNQKIIKEKQSTVRILEQNVLNAPELKKNIDALLANESLSLLRADPQDSTLQVIPDALPTTGDPTTFSNSLYNKVLSKSGVGITAVSVGDQVDQLATAPTPVAEAAPGVATPQPLRYSATITGSQQQIRATIENIERVIRPMSTKQLVINASDGKLTVALSGETYFMPRASIELGKKSIKP